ncbi:MAG: two-component regulator propeller domain-containing protein [bacterium]
MKKWVIGNGKWVTSVALLFVFQCTIFDALQSQNAIGHWRSCLDYSGVNYISFAGDRVYAGTKGGVFCYDLDDYTLTPMSKGAGLNDVGVATMGYDDVTKCLMVAYTNSNVDLVIDGHACNISDIKRSEIPGDKGIYHIRFAGGMAYLATGFGVVVVDILRCEIRETWYLGTGGSYVPVYDLAFVSDSIYAATGEGLKRISTADRHPGVSDRWTTIALPDSLNVSLMENFGGRLIMAGYTSDPDTATLYEHTSTGFRAWNRGIFRSMRAGGGLLTLTRDRSVVRYNANLERYDSVSSYNWGALSAFDAVTAPDGTLWVGHIWEGIIGIHADGKEEYHKPSGPFSRDHCYRLVPFGNRMMLCPGGHTTTYENVGYDANVFTEQNYEWSTLDGGGLLGGITDLVDVAVNPLDTTESVAALWKTGLVSIRGNKATALYDASNTDGALVPYSSGSYSRLNTGAVAYDHQGNLWVLVSNSTHALAVRRNDGTWQGFSTSSMADVNPFVDKLVVDSVTGYKWFLGRHNVIYVHDGVGKMAKVDPNHGSKLTTESVTALVQDQNGNLWLGTNKGIKVIYDGYKAFDNGGNGEESPVNCSNITITNGEFSEYLMAYESITAIAVDGANRKWVGTANGGLYLLSANGLQQLEHFTVANSPLFSDKIVTLGIHERSGEVYIGTDKGLQTYRGTATYAERTPWEEVYAFPNPVKSDYDGPIAIKGFTRNATVHITDASGHTVYSTIANGGQAIWYGRTLSGEKVASGVYYVFASDEEGDNRSVAKILIIR